MVTAGKQDAWIEHDQTTLQGPESYALCAYFSSTHPSQAPQQRREAPSASQGQGGGSRTSTHSWPRCLVKRASELKVLLQ